MKVTVEELQRYLNIERLPEAAAEVSIKSCEVSLSGVRFSYDPEGPEVLHGIDLTMHPGSFTALVGLSGSGKSTIAKLIARFWDVCEGNITIGGTDIREIPLEQLRRYVSFVAQDNFLFRGSILENIRMGRPEATDEEVIEAARLAQCQGFIEKLPEGYHTTAGKPGSGFPAVKSSESPSPTVWRPSIRQTRFWYWRTAGSFSRAGTRS